MTEANAFRRLFMSPIQEGLCRRLIWGWGCYYPAPRTFEVVFYFIFGLGSSLSSHAMSGFRSFHYRPDPWKDSSLTSCFACRVSRPLSATTTYSSFLSAFACYSANFFLWAVILTPFDPDFWSIALSFFLPISSCLWRRQLHDLVDLVHCAPRFLCCPGKKPLLPVLVTLAFLESFPLVMSA